MPYENLYIYYINGKVTTDKRLLGSGFIGNWQEEDCAFLFFSEPADDHVEALVSANGGLRIKDRFSMRYEDWIGGAPSPFSAGRFRITPPSCGPGSSSGGEAILLDPGVVFGSGTHATTRDCIEALEIVFSSAPVSKTIDLGCGTGLLALVAACMGSNRTIAVDNNALAVETTMKNIFLNGLEDRVLAVQGNAGDFVGMEADLLVANIHYDVMRKLVCTDGFLEKKWFVLSGLLRSQAEKIEDRLRQSGAVIERMLIGEGVWYTFVGRWRVDG